MTTRPGEVPHNAAQDSRLTAWFTDVVGVVSGPLAEHVFGPIEERNHMAGVLAVNGVLTAPRLLEVPLAGILSRAIDAGETAKGAAVISSKTGLKTSDGLDGDVARRIGATTTFGAVLDPLVDMIGILSDNVVIYEAAKKEGDRFTAGLAIARTALDLVVVGVSVADYWLDHKLKSMGIEVSKEDEAKAGAIGKLKFALSAGGNPMTQGSYLAKKDSKTRRVLRGAGNTLNSAALVAGVVSIRDYRNRNKRKKSLLKS